MDAASVVTAAATAVLAVFTLMLWHESFKLRSLQTTPHVAVWLESNPKMPDSADLVVKNIGHGPAYGVRLAFVTGAEDYRNPPDQPLTIRYSHRLIVNGAEFLAPGREVRDLFAAIQFLQESPFVLSVTYYPNRKRRQRDAITEHFTINPWEVRGASIKDDTTKALDAIADHLKRIERHIDHQVTINTEGPVPPLSDLPDDLARNGWEHRRRESEVVRIAGMESVYRVVFARFSDAVAADPTDTSRWGWDGARVRVTGQGLTWELAFNDVVERMRQLDAGSADSE